MQETPPMLPIDESSEKIWFTDEKRFTVEAPLNSKNDRVHAAAQKKEGRRTIQTSARTTAILRVCDGFTWSILRWEDIDPLH